MIFATTNHPRFASPYGYEGVAGGTHDVILRRIPSSASVLDVGCNRGYLGAVLHQRGCRVWGIDHNRYELSRIPPGTYETTAWVDLDAAAPTLPWMRERFDVIVAADILEHLRNPERVLRMLIAALAPGGHIIVSLPNIAHASIRANLLRGRFEYRETGILDRTHLHFYTFASARRFVEEAGLHVVGELSGSNRFGRILNGHERIGRILRGLLAFNIVIDGVRR